MVPVPAEEEVLLRSTAPSLRRRRWLVVGYTAVAMAAVVATVLAVGASQTSGHVTVGSAKSSMQLFNLNPFNLFGGNADDGKCTPPEDFCNKNPNREDRLSYRDCDGDGILDPYCEGGELLRFGYLSSANGCKNNWPSGVCIKEKEPSRDVALGNSAHAAGNEITIIHFNDVYQLSGVLSGNVRRGGMSRAAHVIQEERARNPDRTFVVFAGDLLSPSVLSDLFEGEQMVDVLNDLQLDAASLGNHEFDFGVDKLEQRIKESKFPWLNTNLMDENGKLLPGTTERLIKDVPFTPMWGGESKTTRVCMFGSAYDVRETMFKDKERISYDDVLESAKKEAQHLREEKDCSVVLALTHQFSKDDCAMAKELGDSLDLILGGHDHSTEMTTVCGHAPYVKADSDLKTQWIMTLWLDDDGKVDSVDGRLLSLTDADPFDEEIHGKVVEWEEKGEKEMGKTIGCSADDLDGLDAHSRSKETPLGNFFVDAIKEQHKTDVVLINGGTIRGNKVYEKGELSKKIVTEMHPFGNAIVKFHATGKEIRAYIEQTLECYESVCGAFVQVAGLKYTFDPKAKTGKRLKKLTYSDGKALKDGDKLTVAMSNYMLANSPMRGNKLYNMVTLNDAVPIVTALFQATRDAHADGKCISPKSEGRITILS